MEDADDVAAWAQAEDELEQKLEELSERQKELTTRRDQLRLRVVRADWAVRTSRLQQNGGTVLKLVELWSRFQRHTYDVELNGSRVIVHREVDDGPDEFCFFVTSGGDVVVPIGHRTGCNVRRDPPWTWYVAD